LPFTILAGELFLQAKRLLALFIVNNIGVYMSNCLLLIGSFILQSFILISCKKEPAASTNPYITISSSVTSVAEDDPNGSVNISLILSGTSNKAVTLDYNTADSTAIAGKDYVAVLSGRLTVPPGEISKAVTVNIIRDTSQKQDVFFKVIFSNPVNGILTRSSGIIKIVNVDYANLVWSDEFNDGPLNSSIWDYELGAGGWGNNELENYTYSINNVHIDSGYLHITALNPSIGSYTSGRITTQGKKEFTHGRVEIRAQLPEGRGLWPALWMLGGNFSSIGWPECGEIDMMELVGDAPSTIYGSVHWNNNGHASRSNSFTLSGSKFSSGFHVFSFIWTPNRLIWLVDNQQYSNLRRSEISTFPFDLPQFFIFNVAVGGDWPEAPDQTTVFPQNMIVDYIRVYQ
jgi:beta-glucanase (GH16 family)